MVMATASRAAQALGSRVQFGPRSELRGHRPAPVRTRWSATTALSTHGHACGRTITAAAAPMCNTTEARMAGEGR